ncbi:MAG: DUF4230 domain-containing protein [Cyanobacteria bacterium J06600_6]
MKTSGSKSFFWQRLLLWSAGAVNLLILLILFSLWRTSDRALNFVSNLLRISPVESKVEDSEPIINRIKNIQELSTTVQTMETIVPASAVRKLGDLPLATTRLLYIARGEIRAGVDLSELTAADIKVTDSRIEINLPAAKILDSKIDVNHSRVYDYDRGFLNLGPDVAPQLQSLAQRKTLVQMIDTACNEDILQSANIRAKEVIIQLLSNTTAQNIKVNTTSPTICSSN